MSRGLTMHCPHCAGAATVRTSLRQTAIYREITYMCRDPMCGHVFVCGLEVVRTLSPASKPNPEINLPLSRHVRRRELISQLQVAIEA